MNERLKLTMIHVGEIEISNIAMEVITEFYKTNIYGICISENYKSTDDVTDALSYSLGEILAHMFVSGTVSLKDSLSVSRELASILGAIPEDQLLELVGDRPAPKKDISPLDEYWEKRSAEGSTADDDEEDGLYIDGED